MAKKLNYVSEVDFESHVLHHYEFIGDKLIIGKFCQIASGVTFIMNGANHQMNAASTYPFYIMGWEQGAPTHNDLPLKGDTIIGNDVWIGQNVTILPGVHIGDIPVMAGGGVNLFEETGHSLNLRMVDTITYNGVVETVYKRRFPRSVQLRKYL